MITVYFFGRVSDLVGKRHLEIDAGPPAMLFALRDQIFDGIDVSKTPVRMSVNKVVVREDILLNDGDEVAFFSVFSGG